MKPNERTKAAPQEVEAEVIEDGGLAVSFTPAAIEANFAALDARVGAMVAGYADARYDLTDAEAVKQAKRDRAYLNGVAKEIDERRKAVKREYMRPYDEFEAKANAVAAKVKAASANIKEQLDEAEERRKDRACAVLREYYEDLAGLLAPVVPYGRIHEEKWLNKTFGEVKAKKAIDEKVSKAAHDWETLKAQKETLPRYETAERAFFETLDLGSALTAAREAQAADERIAELREAVEGRPAGQMPDTDPETVPEARPEPAPAPVEQAPVQPAPMPAPVPPVPTRPAPTAADRPAETLRRAMALASGPSEKPPVPCVVVVDSATVEQMRALGMLCGLVGITGTFKMGTLAEVCEREFGGRRG